MKQTFTPRPYQKLITAHALDMPRCAIWAGMGLGKTTSTLNALDTLFMAGEDAPVLVIAPLRVAATTWPDEAAKWAHLRHVSVVPVVGGEKDRLSALRSGASVFTTNYEQLPWLVEHYGTRWPFKTVVADESTKLKGFRLRQGTQRAGSLRLVAHSFVDRFIELTGTPSPNGLQDLWGQIWFLDRGQRLGKTYDGFKQRWFEKSYDGYSITPSSFAQAEIQELLHDICLTIDAKDWFDLAEPNVNNVFVDMPVSARRLYTEMEKAMFCEIEEHPVEAFSAASRTIKCLQLANGAAYVGDAGAWKETHNAKLDALESIENEAHGPLLVAYHFKSDLARIMKAFPKARHLDKDPQTIKDWNAGKIPMLLAHPASAGHGLNLQDGGHELVFFGHWWNLEERLQITERIGPTRQAQAGHQRPVFIHNIIARDTVDELVMSRVETKREVQDILLDAMKRRRR